jgi:hypothetical protein
MDPICFNYEEPFFEGSCVRCTCERCGNDIRDGSCWFCVSNTYNNFPNFSDYPPQPDYSHNDYNSYEQYPYFNDESFQNAPISQLQNGCENCGGPHFSTDCQTREPFPYDNNYHDQPPQYDTILTVQNEILKMMTTQNDFNELCLNTINLFKEVIRIREQEPETITEVVEIASSQSTPLVPPPDSSKCFAKFQFCECCMYYDDDDSTITIALNPQNKSISPSIEPEDSLKMGDEHLHTIPATESDEFNKSSVENLVPIPSESEEISNDYDEDDDDLVPRVSESFNMTFTNPLFDFDLELTLDNPIFDISCDESEMEPEVQDSPNMIDSPHEKFSDELTHTIFPPNIENNENGFQRNVLTEEIRYDDLLPNTDSILVDLPSFRPPAKPPDVDFESETYDIFGVVDETYDHDDPVFDILPTQPTHDSDDVFAFIIWVFQPFYTYPIVSSFHSTGSEDTVFDPGISVYAECLFHLLSPRTN